MDPIKIKDSDRVLFVGTTGFGKTELARFFLRGMNRVVVIDPKHMIQWEGYRRGRGLPTFGDDFHVIYRPRLEDDFELAMLIHKLGKMKRLTIYCDELMSLVEMFPEATRQLEDVVRTGRERHVAVWSAMQRPRWVPIFFLSEAEVKFQFYLNDFADRERMSHFSTPEVLDDLDYYQFWYYRVNQKVPQLMTLDKAKGSIIGLVRDLEP